MELYEASSNMVNIPRYVNDPFYRYKMPTLKLKIEGRGNGIKTCVENMNLIGKALNRRSDYPTKFIGFSLGVMVNIDTKDDRYILNGKHDEEDVYKHIDTFIDKYVICEKCHIPETDLLIKKENVFLVCKACGHITYVDVSQKLTIYIIKNPPNVAEKSVVSKKESKIDRKTKKENIKKEKEQTEEEEDNDWAVSTSPEAVNIRRRKLLGSNNEDLDLNKSVNNNRFDILESINVATNPIPFMTKYWETLPIFEDAYTDMKKLLDIQKWNELNSIKYIFASLFADDHKRGFMIKARYLKMFITTAKHQKYVLHCVETLYQKKPEVIEDIVNIIYNFWDEHVLDDEIIIKWYDSHTKSISNEISDKIKIRCNELVEWLNHD